MGMTPRRKRRGGAVQITRPTGRPRTPTTQTTKRPRWVVGGTTILTFVALLYLVELIDQLSGSRLDVNGIRPLKQTACGASSLRHFCTRTGTT